MILIENKDLVGDRRLYPVIGESPSGAVVMFDRCSHGTVMRSAGHSSSFDQGYHHNDWNMRRFRLTLLRRGVNYNDDGHR